MSGEVPLWTPDKWKDVQNRLAVVEADSISSGTSFPPSPADQERFFRTDRGIEYFYDLANTRWLSVQKFNLQIGTGLDGITDTLASSRVSNPAGGLYSIYVTEIVAWILISGTGQWSFVAAPINAANDLPTIAQATNKTSSAAQGDTVRTPVGTVYDTTLNRWQLSATKSSGTATVYYHGTVVYHLVG